MLRPIIASATLSLAPVAALANDFQPVTDLSQFISLVDGRELRLGLFGVSLKVLPDGRIDGSALGDPVTGLGHGRTATSAARWTGVEPKSPTTASWSKCAKTARCALPLIRVPESPRNSTCADEWFGGPTPCRAPRLPPQSPSTSGCHHRGLPPLYEWLAGRKGLRCGLSNTPVSRATTGASSIAPIELPQVGQKARDDLSDDRQTAGTPPGPVQTTASLSTSTQVAVRLPVWRWHMRQEHVCGNPGVPVTRNRMFPHRHPPSRNVSATRPHSPPHGQKSTAIPFFSQSP